MFIILIFFVLIQRTFIVMGTEMTVRIIPEGTCDEKFAREIAGEIYRVVQDIEVRMSGWRKGSYTDLINRSAGESPIRVSDDYIELIENAYQIYRLTEGVFDITSCPLIRSIREGDNVKAKVGMDKVIIDGNAVFLPFKGMCIDVDGILKGFALDKAYSKLDGLCPRFYIEIGGDVCGKEFEAVIPYKEREYSLHIRSGCVATSGVYGKEYDDFVNPKKNLKERNCELASVYHQKGTFADALATYLLIKGKEGLQVIEKAGGEGMCISGGNLYQTEGFRKISIHP